MKQKIFFIILLTLLSGLVKSQTNVALNRPVVSSDITNWSTLAPKALDGNTTTSLYVNSTSNRYFVIDLGLRCSISKIRVNFGANFPQKIEVWSSINNIDFLPITGIQETISTPAVPAINVATGITEITSLITRNKINQHRYIKFVFNKNTAPSFVADLIELEVIGTKCFTLAYTYNNNGSMLTRTILYNETSGLKSATIDTSMQAKIIQPEEIYTDQLDKSNVTIYPNPTKGELSVEVTNLESTLGLKILIYDSNGRLVFQQQNATENTTINIKNQPVGTYILKIMNDKSSIDWKIIKQ